MKRSLYKKYQKPKIQENKLKTNFLSFKYPNSDHLLVNYCGQLSDCKVERIIPGCDLYSC